jgi:streptomycin 6-kinase
MADVPDVVRRTASTHEAGRRWLRDLDGLVSEIERLWSLTVGETLAGGTVAYVARARTAAGDDVVLKLAPPELEGKGGFAYELRTLEVAAGRGCVRLLAGDVERGAALLEPLGRRLADLGMTVEEQLHTIATTVRDMWVPVPEHVDLPGLDAKAGWLAEFIGRLWEELGRPCAQATVERGLEYARRRGAAYDPASAVLVHGDAHQWNTLEDTRGGFSLVDPDGLRGEAAYDLAVPLREVVGTVEQGHEWCRLLADSARCDPVAVWEWSLVERVSTGLLCIQDGIEPGGTTMLRVADEWAASS